MAPLDISNSALMVSIQYFDINGNLTTTPLSAATIQTLGAVPGLSGLSSQLASLEPYLSQPLVNQFNAGWQNSGPAASLQTNFTSTLQQNGVSVSHVGATVPPTGSLLAETVNAIPANGSTPEVPGELTFTFAVPGCSISYETSSVSGSILTLGLGNTRDEWNVSFDFQVVISTSVPLRPFSLAFSAIGEASNADNKPENATADIDTALDDVLVILGQIANDLGISVSGTDIPSTVQPTESQQLDNGLDNTQTVLGGALGIGTLSNSLNGSGPELINFGFAQCNFSVVPASSTTGSLLLTLTHPLDPAPVLYNPNDLAGTLHNPASLSASTPQVKPLGTVSVTGFNFPVNTTTQLSVAWANTSSGLAPATGGGQIEVVGPAGAPGTGTFPVNLQAGNLYSYTMSTPTPGTYIFIARNQDLLSWSPPSAAFSISTASTDLVNLVLRAAGDASGGTVIGHANLSQVSTQWECTGAIPGGTADGTYDLIAQLSGGEVLATTTILVANALSPVLELFDPTNNVVITEPIIGGGGPFTVRGENFPSGSVLVSVNGAEEIILLDPTGTFERGLTAPGGPSEPESIPVVVTALSLGVIKVAASVSFTTIGAPQ